MKTKQTYSVQFKEQALSKVLQRGSRTVGAVADELNVNVLTLRKWMRGAAVANRSSGSGDARRPEDWRRIIVPGSIRLGKLHVVLLLAMGWEGGHLHEFVFGETSYGEPDDFGFPSDPPMLNEVRVTLAKALGGLKSFTYIYDYGDNWRHRIKVGKALVPDPDMRWPLCLDGQNACPPEDVGGVPGYADFLEAIADPTHEEHDHFVEWCGGSFDPAVFDLVLANQRLSEVSF